jgi:methanogenic corrinoid protein MtbC1
LLPFDRLRTEPMYNTQAVVRRTGVPADTFRAWERRYRVPCPTRSPGNQRLYSERDIATIAWLRDQTTAGLAISQAVALLRSERGRRYDESTGMATGIGHEVLGATDVGPRLGEFRDRIVAALIDFDGARADRVAEEAIALVPVEDVCLHVLQAALVEIGERWEHHGLSVGAEHFASSFVLRKLAALFNLSQPEDGQGPVVAACVEGEMHEIGLLLTCLFLSRHGYRILYLGANLPQRDLLLTVRQVRPRLVVLSATSDPSVESLIRAGAALRTPLNGRGSAGRPLVGYGGRVFIGRPDLRVRIDAIYLGDDARESVRAVDHLFAAEAA